MSAASPDVALCRALLFTPGNRPDRFAKAAATGADGLILDLEDAVALAAKDAVRATLVEHFRAGYRTGVAPTQRCGLRVNNVHTGAGVRDLDALVTAGVRPDFVVLPRSSRRSKRGSTRGTFRGSRSSARSSRRAG